MAVLETTYNQLRSRWRDYQRWAADAFSGPVLFLFLAAIIAYSALNPDTRQLFVVGVVVGSILALGALGLTLIYGVLKFGNFAHGDMMVLGGYVAFFFLTGRVLREGNEDAEALPGSLDSLPSALDKIGDLTFGYGLIIATVLSAIAMALLFIGLDRLIYRPLRRRRASVVILGIASLGVALVVRSSILIFWGPDPRVFVSGIHPAQSLPFDITLKTDQIFILVAAILLTAVMYLLLYRTKLGKAMRAMSDNPDLARISGINTERVTLWTWAIGGALVAVAGVLLAIQSQLNPQLGFVILLPLFASAILGGLGNPLGALAGGMIVGIAQEVSTEFFATGYKPGVAFIILITILLLRPRGLFGARV
jgi:branched-chain amino acid transport system permease protein/neutral amino acid transport system permease protein